MSERALGRWIDSYSYNCSYSQIEAKVNNAGGIDLNLNQVVEQQQQQQQQQQLAQGLFNIYDDNDCDMVELLASHCSGFGYREMFLQEVVEVALKGERESYMASYGATISQLAGLPLQIRKPVFLSSKFCIHTFIKLLLLTCYSLSQILVRDKASKKADICYKYINAIYLL